MHMCSGENVRAFTPDSTNRIKHPNIAKILENRSTPASPNEWNTAEDEQSLHELEEQLFIHLTIKKSYFLSLAFCLPLLLPRVGANNTDAHQLGFRRI